MYTAFYGFNQKPFNLTPDPQFFYLGENNNKALAHLQYGIENRKGFIALTGEVGSGKTTLCRLMLKKLDKDISVALILNSLIDELTLLKQINRDFGIPHESDSQDELIGYLYDFLISEKKKGRNVVVIVDECQNLKFEVLEQIRMLSNLETEKDKLLQILLIGQPEFNDMLQTYELRQLNSRITVRSHIQPLSLEETHKYILHRLKVAGNEDAAIWTPQALKVIHKFSDGIPRKINVVCDFALLAGYAGSTRKITGKIATQAISDIEVNAPKKSSQDRELIGASMPHLGRTALLVLLFLVILGVYREPVKSGITDLSAYFFFTGNHEAQRASIASQSVPSHLVELESFSAVPSINSKESKVESLAKEEPKGFEKTDLPSLPEEAPLKNTKKGTFLVHEDEKGDLASLEEGSNEPSVESVTEPVAESSAESKEAASSLPLSSDNSIENETPVPSLEEGDGASEEAVSTLEVNNHEAELSPKEDKKDEEPLALETIAPKKEPSTFSLPLPAETAPVQKDLGLFGKLELKEKGVWLLLSTWGIEINHARRDHEGNIIPLENQLDRFNFSLFQTWADLAMMEKINLPCALQIVDEKGEHYWVLSGIKDGFFRLRVDPYETKILKKEELLKIWQGHSLILVEQGPFTMDSQTIFKGHKGGATLKLRAILNQIGYELDLSVDLYDISLEKVVKAFQEEAGLVPDGIVGVEAKLLFYSRLAKNIPRIKFKS